MSVELLEKLTSLGKELGYTGVELRDWVAAQVQAEEKKQLAIAEREERRLQREEHHRQIATKAQEEIRAREEARAKEEVEHRREVERQESERSERLEQARMEQEEKIKRLELQHEREMKKTELKAANKCENKQDVQSSSDSDAGGEAAISGGHSRRKRAGPKLPYFDENKDNIDSYLRRFERYAKLQNWPEDDWAIYLSALLKGKALEVYSRLTETEARNYARLKGSLLRKYQLTVEGFRSKFYAARREKEETASQFVSRIEGYLDRWIQLAEIEQSFQGLKELIVKEQFLAVSEEPFAIYLRERETRSLYDLVQLADKYLDARLYRSGTDRRRSDRPNSKHLRADERAQEQPNENDARGFRTDKTDKTRQVCYHCNQAGHIRRNCPARVRSGDRKPAETVAACQGITEGTRSVCSHTSMEPGTLQLQCGCELPYVGCLSVGVDSPAADERLPMLSGKVNGQKVTVLRDTGCTTAVVRTDLVSEEQRTGRQKCYRLMDGAVRRAEVAMVDVESPVFTGKVECLCVKEPICDLIIGNIPGAVEKTDSVVAAVTTRAQQLRASKPMKPLNVPVLQDLQVSCADVQQMQAGSSELRKYFDLVESQKLFRSGKSGSVRYEIRKGILYRVYQVPARCEIRQLVVPRELRKVVLGLAHDSVMSGHGGVRRTTDRVMSNFWWPGVHGDVARYCRSCDVCQRTVPKGRVSKAPLQKMPVISVPFQRVGVDLIGPIVPASSSGKRFVLTVVDYATRYPEAVALSGISTEAVAEALCSIYSRVGIPTHVMHDQGSQFMSDVMTEVNRLLSVQRLVSTPYHPQCNGLVERFNATLKAMLKKLCSERPKDWDRYLESVLFAYREVPQESTGFSPFELLYGRTVRGPMAILRELWTQESPSDEVRTTYQYVLDLRNRLEETCQIVKQSLEKASAKAKKHFDRKARLRELQPGDLALILLPTAHSKLLMQWQGPYPVTERVGPTDYRIRVDDSEKLYHINMLKRYYKPVGDEGDTETAQEEHIAAAVLDDVNEDLGGILPSVPLKQEETVADVHISEELEAVQADRLKQLLEEFKDIFTDKPGLTNIAEHCIVLVDDNPVCCKSYPLPHSLRESTIKKSVIWNVRG